MQVKCKVNAVCKLAWPMLNRSLYSYLQLLDCRYKGTKIKPNQKIILELFPLNDVNKNGVPLHSLRAVIFLFNNRNFMLQEVTAHIYRVKIADCCFLRLFIHAVTVWRCDAVTFRFCIQFCGLFTLYYIYIIIYI